MDIKFHYYQTFLIAAKTGFAPEEAEVIAYASQHVDDNDMIFEINKDTAHYFRNYISQTINIHKPKNKLLCIYHPLFHFIPQMGQKGTIPLRDSMRSSKSLMELESL